MNNPFSKNQTEVIINGFIKYHTDKKDIKKVLISSMPVKGVWIDNDFYKEDDILKPFIEKYWSIKNKKEEV